MVVAFVFFFRGVGYGALGVQQESADGCGVLESCSDNLGWVYDAGFEEVFED